MLYEHSFFFFFFFWGGGGVVLIAQLVEVTDSAVLGGVVEVVSSNPTQGHENIYFITFSGIADLVLYIWCKRDPILHVIKTMALMTSKGSD